MKPFLGIDLTTDKRNEKNNGDEFLVAVPSSAMTQAFERSAEKAEETLNSIQLPPALYIVQWICGIFALIVVSGVLKALDGDDGISFAQAYKNASWLFLLAGICLLIWGVLTLISIQKRKSILDSDDASHVFSSLDCIGDGIYSELSVPPDAKEIDILSFFYKIKNGNIKVCERDVQIAPYVNSAFKIFADSDKLYVANLEGKYAFPLSSLVSIHTVKKTISVLGWNKDEAFNKGIYKKYRLTADNYGCIHCKCYYILEIARGDELWGIYIPCYDLPIIEELTGLKADEQ